MFDLNNYSFLTIILVGLAVILLASEIGRWLGARTEDRDSSNVSTLESAVFGLLALMLGFTFAMALSRFEARRDAVLNEANAIGTTALRARLLPEPERKEVLQLLKQYVKIRLEITQRPVSRTELMTAISQSNALQESLWQQAATLAAKNNGMVPTGLFVQTLNDMIDNQGKRLAALRNRVPNIVLLALFGIAIVGSGFAGYANGLDLRRTQVPVFIMAVLVSGVIFLILDLDRPGGGFIAVSQQPMIDTAASIDAVSN
jgi:hypothetical protein